MKMMKKGLQKMNRQIWAIAMFFFFFTAAGTGDGFLCEPLGAFSTAAAEQIQGASDETRDLKNSRDEGVKTGDQGEHVRQAAAVFMVGVVLTVLAGLARRRVNEGKSPMPAVSGPGKRHWLGVFKKILSVRT